MIILAKRQRKAQKEEDEQAKIKHDELKFRFTEFGDAFFRSI